MAFMKLQVLTRWQCLSFLPQTTSHMKLFENMESVFWGSLFQVELQTNIIFINFVTCVSLQAIWYQEIFLEILQKTFSWFLKCTDFFS